MATTQSQSVDEATRRFLEWQRQIAMQYANTALAGPGGGRNGPLMGGSNGGSWYTGPLTQTPAQMAEPFMNAYQQNVIDATRGEFDFLRGQALNRTRQQATLGGGFGGSRMAVLAGSRLGELDRAQASQIAGLLHTGYDQALTRGTAFAEHNRRLREQQIQEPLFRYQQAQAASNLGLPPTGQTFNTTHEGAPWWQQVLGAGLAVLGAYQGGGGGGQSNPTAYPNQYAYGPSNNPNLFRPSYQSGQTVQLSNGDWITIY